MSRWKLVSFDLDGTLIRGTCSAEHLSTKLGGSSEIAEFEQKYSRGEVTNVEFGDLIAKRFRGYSKSEIFQFLEDAPEINHISETVDYFSSRGIGCVISTMAWDFVAEFFALKHGLTEWSGPTLEVDLSGTFTGNIKQYFHETEKVSFVESICRRENFSISDVIHIGDSRSDYPLFEAAGYSVALNGTQEACDRAHSSISTSSLLEVVSVIPDLA